MKALVFFLLGVIVDQLVMRYLYLLIAEPIEPEEYVGYLN